MNIGLYHCDGKMANLALMKLASWHRAQGDRVEMFWPLNDYDKVYVSKLFQYTPLPTDIMCQQVIIGGTGYDISISLSDEIERCQPDYTIYPGHDYSLQLFSRGCPRRCRFCIVPQKEGAIRPVQPMTLNPKGKWIEVLDNNFFANPYWPDALAWLKMINQPVNFHGVDARILDERMMRALLSLKHRKQIKMAWDNPKDKIDWDSIIKIIPAWKIMVYVLIGFGSDEKQDLYRVNTIQALGMDPFVMPYDKFDSYQAAFARWCNKPQLRKSIEWKDYRRDYRRKKV